jgi:MYXO-CTERM domain-containing protein
MCSSSSSCSTGTVGGGTPSGTTGYQSGGSQDSNSSSGCSVSGAPGRDSGSAWLLVLCGVALVGFGRRRNRSRLGGVILAVAAASLMIGCGAATGDPSAGSTGTRASPLSSPGQLPSEMTRAAESTTIAAHSVVVQAAPKLPEIVRAARSR